MRFLAPLLAAPLLVTPLLFAEARTRQRPARISAPDAGVAGIAIHVAGDGGSDDAGPSASDALQAVRRQLTELQSRTATLEYEAQRNRNQERLLQQLSDQVAGLRQQIAQGQQQQADTQQQAATQREDTERAVSSLSGIQGSLAGGNLDVDAALAEAQGLLPPQAQRDLQAAREAVRNRDLYNARAHVAQAIANAQQGR